MIKWLLPILLMISISGAQVRRQIAPVPTKKDFKVRPLQVKPQNQNIIAVIKKVERGIQTNMIGMFEHEFGSMISISLGSSERGYVSANQIVSMLSNYFSNRRPISFEFSRIQDRGATPYATGRLVYIQKGNQESAQVYMALTYQESRWVITQLNIY